MICLLFASDDVIHGTQTTKQFVEECWHFIFWNAVRNKSILIIFGIENSEEVWLKCLWNYPPHLKNISTLLVNSRPKVVFNNKCSWAFAVAAYQVLIACKWVYWETVNCGSPTNLQNYVIYSVFRKKHPLLFSYITFSQVNQFAQKFQCK